METITQYILIITSTKKPICGLITPKFEFIFNHDELNKLERVIDSFLNENNLDCFHDTIVEKIEMLNRKCENKYEIKTIMGKIKNEII